MPRSYRLNRRAERQADTRQRIVDAAIAQHELGVNEATITAIAKRAGVSRVTIYRHFPDELSLLVACTSTYMEGHPFPDAAAWAAIPDPTRRMATALTELYGWFADNERMLASGYDALATHPALAQALEPSLAGLGAVAELLAIGWDVPSGPGTLIAGAIGHAVTFPTWRSLRHEQGLSNGQAVTLMVAMATAAGDAAARSARRAPGSYSPGSDASEPARRPERGGSRSPR